MRFVVFIVSIVLTCQTFICSQVFAAQEYLSAPEHEYSEAALERLKKGVISNKKAGDRSFGNDENYQFKKFKYYDELSDYINVVKEESGAEGISVSVISSDDLLFLRGYGYTDKETKAPVSPLTLFRVGSVSKIFTGIAIMQLVEQELVDLDAPLETYIHDFSYKTHFPEAGPITVRTLMTHQSGLVGDILKEGVSNTYPANHFSELVGYFAKEYLAYPPNYMSTYSNSGVALLGVVVEEVTGQEFKEYVKEHICNPIGMLLSNFTLRDDMSPFFAKSYAADGSETPHIYMRHEPAGSFISNAIEMTLFMKMILKGGKLFGHRILLRSSLEEMFTPQNSDVELDLPNDHGAVWGLSWVLKNNRIAYAGKYAGHDGYWPSYATQMHILPEHGFAVIVETNSEQGLNAAPQIADMAVIKAMEIFKGINEPAPDPVPPIVPLASEHISLAAGTYITNFLGCVFIFPEEDKLLLFSPVIDVVECVPHADNWFSIEKNGEPLPGFENIRFTVKQGQQERFLAMEVRDENGTLYQTTMGAEYDIPETLEPAWIDRVGQYKIINPDPLMLYPIENISISLSSQGVLYYTIDDFQTVLDPMNGNEAIRAGRGRNLNQTISVVSSMGNEYLYHLGYLFEKQPTPSVLEEKGIQMQPDSQKKGEQIVEEIIRHFRFPGW